MKKSFYFFAVALSILTATVLLTAFAPKLETDGNTMEDQCVEWQKSSNSNIQFRWCKDPEVFNATSYQFFNGYRFKVWYYFRLNYSNGESFTGNTILDGGEYSNKGSMYKRIPNSWRIEKKLRQDDLGKWVEF